MVVPKAEMVAESSKTDDFVVFPILSSHQLFSLNIKFER